MTSVGKAFGKNKYRCFIKQDDGGTDSIDFQTEVPERKYIPKEVSFDADEDAEKSTSNETMTKDKSLKEKWVTHMFYMSGVSHDVEEHIILQNINEVIHLMAVGSKITTKYTRSYLCQRQGNQ